MFLGLGRPQYNNNKYSNKHRFQLKEKEVHLMHNLYTNKLYNNRKKCLSYYLLIALLAVYSKRKSTEAADGHRFLFLPRTLAYLIIPIKNPVDESNFLFLIPFFCMCAISKLFLLLNKRGVRVPQAVS